MQPFTSVAALVPAAPDPAHQSVILPAWGELIAGFIFFAILGFAFAEALAIFGLVLYFISA